MKYEKVMYYPNTDEEFSDYILKAIEEIKGMKNISEEHRNDLYKLVDETVQRREELKNLHLEENFKHLAEAMTGLYTSLGKIGMIGEELKKALPGLERILSDLQKIKKSQENDLNNRVN
jgi:hypothetical protein